MGNHLGLGHGSLAAQLMSMEHFAQACYWVIEQIPQGRVLSYGNVALRAGFAGYARHVGRLLKHLPPDSLLPWHRVVKSNGELAFALNSESYLRQRHLLEAEGVVFRANKIVLRLYQWQ